MPPRFPYLIDNDRATFGRAIDQLAEETHPDRKTNNAIVYLIEKTGIAKNTLYHCIDGEFKKKNGKFTPTHFQKLINHFWTESRNPLRDVSDIYALAHAAGEDFSNELHKKWFKELVYSETPVSRIEHASNQYPLPTYQDQREDVIQNIILRIKSLQSYETPLVIYGPPGIGKTTLMKSIQKNSDINEIFSGGVFVLYLGEKQIRPDISKWGRELGLNYIDESEYSEQLQSIGKKLRNMRALVVVDNVGTASEIKRLIKILDLRHNKCVITTNKLQIVNELTKIENQKFRLSGFTLPQTLKYISRIWKVRLSNQQKIDVEKILQIIDGNPLSLHYVMHAIFRTASPRFREVYELLSTSYMAKLTSSVEEFFKPEEIIFNEVMEEYLKKYISALGLIPFFKSYTLDTLSAFWDVNLESAKRIVFDLENYGWVEKTNSENDNAWKIHVRGITVARKYAPRFNEAFNLSHTWFDRIDQDRFNKNIDQIMKEVKRTSLRERIVLSRLYRLNEKQGRDLLINLWSSKDAYTVYDEGSVFKSSVWGDIASMRDEDFIVVKLVNENIKQTRRQYLKILSFASGLVVLIIISSLLLNLGATVETVFESLADLAMFLAKAVAVFCAIMTVLIIAWNQTQLVYWHKTYTQILSLKEDKLDRL